MSTSVQIANFHGEGVYCHAAEYLWFWEIQYPDRPNEGTYAILRKKNFQGQAICTEGQSLFEEERESYAFTQYPRPTTYPSADSDQPHEANFMGYSVVSEHFRLTNWFKFDHAVSVSKSIYYYTGCLREKYTIL